MTNELPRYPVDGLEGGLFGTLGFVLDTLDPEAGEIRGHVPVTAGLMQPAGIVHGGVYAAFAETLGSAGTHLVVREEGKQALGLSNQTSFLRPVTSGTIHGVGIAKHRGRTTWVWEIEISDDEGRLCALSRMTIAVR